MTKGTAATRGVLVMLAINLVLAALWWLSQGSEPATLAGFAGDYLVGLIGCTLGFAVIAVGSWLRSRRRSTIDSQGLATLTDLLMSEEVSYTSAPRPFLGRWRLEGIETLESGDLRIRLDDVTERAWVVVTVTVSTLRRIGSDIDWIATEVQTVAIQSPLEGREVEL